MKRSSIFLLWTAGCFLVSLAVASLGQNARIEARLPHEDGRGTVKMMFPHERASTQGDRQAAEAFLARHAADFGLSSDLGALELVSERESLIVRHFRFRQVLNGIPVEGADVVVSLRLSDGSVYQAANDTYPVRSTPLRPKRILTPDEALDHAWNHVRVHGRLMAAPAAELLYIPDKGGFRLIYKTMTAVDAPFGYWEHKIDAVSGAILSVRDNAIPRKKRAIPVPDFDAYTGAVRSRADSTRQWSEREAARKAALSKAKTLAMGSACVFDPDPRNTLMNDALEDGSDATAFSNAYVTRVLRDITLNAGIYSLTGPWVQIADFESPNTAPSTTAGGQWTQSRGNNAFNDVMCYFHIDQNQRYLQSLGFTNAKAVVDFSIETDSDGLDGDDNSHYIPATKQLAFGHGGVDDDEDADVILHEYGHAINDDIIPTWSGGDTGAIGEGFGDYWGGAYSYATLHGTNYHPEWAFTWDGHSADTWSGRFMNMTNLTYDHSHYYDAHEEIGGIDNYSDQLWGTPIFQAFVTLRQMGIPREEVDRIVIESYFGMSSSPKMREMASATVNAAKLLYPSGPHADVFFEKFASQLILTSLPLSAPTILSPSAGDILLTGRTVKVLWNRNGVKESARAQVEYMNSSAGGSVFLDTMESGTNGWTVNHTGGSENWAQVTDSSYSPTHAWFAVDLAEVGSQHLITPWIVLPDNGTLAFWHRYSLERGADIGYDGGVVEISTNGTAWEDIGTNATANGYDAIIDTGYSNPIGGRQAFTGSQLTYRETLIPLSSYKGKPVKIRFLLATDDGTGETGWWVDDVSVGNSAGWTLIAQTVTNENSCWWAPPAAPGTNYLIRAKHFAPGSADSSWAQNGPFIVSEDSDGDGLPDDWERRYFTNLTYASGTSDRDGDGADEGLEFLSGTKPTAAESVFEAYSLGTGPFADLRIVRWMSVSNRTYFVSRSTNLMEHFTGVISNMPATPPENVYTDAPPMAPSVFYRIATE